MASIKWEYAVAFFLALCSVLLIFLLLVQEHYVESYRVQIFQEIENVESAGFALQETPESPISERSLEEYSELVERPLFFNERRPIVPGEGAEEEPEVAKKALKEISLKLIGIINIPGSVYALFQDSKAKPDENKFKRLKQGGNVNGWTLKEIKPDRVIISSGKDTEEILLAKPRTHKRASKRRAPTKKPKRPNPFNRKTKK
ncbi:MAG: hypothetical protein KAJ63_14055 [Methyloprofundus sp.]|nr:hypothetical protein [Methyloprofundus sp.]